MILIIVVIAVDMSQYLAFSCDIILSATVITFFLNPCRTRHKWYPFEPSKMMIVVVTVAIGSSYFLFPALLRGLPAGLLSSFVTIGSLPSPLPMGPCSVFNSIDTAQLYRHNLHTPSSYTDFGIVTASERCSLQEPGSYYRRRLKH